MVCLCAVSIAFGQREERDTIVLKDVVYTGQVSPQRIDRSVYEVKMISKEEIEQSAAVNLADLLNQTLNIQITPNASTGKSGMSLMGLNSQYVKVLVDNIPIINDEGLGNFTDFTQINLSDIAQIEIVEGAMAVEYGADAVSGVINIITEKSASKKPKAQIYVQEETIGNEFNFKDQGRHIVGIDFKKILTPKLHAGINYNQNLFNGFYNGRKGESYAQNDGLRGHEWLPKQQYDGKAFLRYNLNGTKFFYRFNYFQEQIQKYNQAVDERYNPQFDLSFPVAQDEAFKTQRWYHVLNVNGNAWRNANFNLSFSYQSQDRDATFYSYDILNDQRFNLEDITYESRKTYYSKGLVQHNFSPKLSLQLGYEVNQVKGTQSPMARSVDSSTNFIERELGSYDVYASTDIHVSESVTVRPGIRALFSSQFNQQFAYSLSTSYAMPKGWELRAIYGMSPKNPTYEELYTRFIDSNHYVVGNEDLKAEKGRSIFVHLKKEKNFDHNFRLNSKLSAWHMKVKDQVELLVINQQPLQYQFMNFETFSSRGLTLTNGFSTPRLNAQLGASYLGISYASNNKDILYSWQANFMLNYHFPKAKLYLSSSYKLNGAQYQWVLNTQTNNLEKGKTDAYAWWDASLKKELFNDFELVAGVRNLMNVINVNTTSTPGGAHSDQPRNLLLGYGRSFFLRLKYNIPFK